MELSQKKLVLQHLQEHGSITSIEAIDLFGATRLSAIIWKLRHNDGYDIISDIEKVKTRYGVSTHITRYRLNS